MYPIGGSSHYTAGVGPPYCLHQGADHLNPLLTHSAPSRPQWSLLTTISGVPPPSLLPMWSLMLSHCLPLILLNMNVSATTLLTPGNLLLSALILFLMADRVICYILLQLDKYRPFPVFLGVVMMPHTSALLMTCLL